MPDLRTASGLVLVLVLLAVTACGNGTGTGPGGTASPSGPTGASAPTQPLGVAEALEKASGSTVRVRGYLVADGSRTVLAEMLAESYPPQAGGATVGVVGVDLDTLDGVSTVDGISWTDTPVEFAGVIADGVLTVG